MKPVFQTKFGPTDGNCFAACLASLLEIPIEQIPDVQSQDPGVWFKVFESWLSGRNASALEVDLSLTDWRPHGLAIGTIESPRHRGFHAVVIDGNRIAHDPHPEGGSEGAQLLYALVIYPLDPARPILRALPAIEGVA